MDMVIDFPGGARVDAHFGTYDIATDQPVADGGSGSAASPFVTFLASIGTCAGIYVLGFCRQRGISTDGLRLIQRMDVDHATGMATSIAVTIELPPSFPEKYVDAVVRAADQCTVKRHFERPPTITVRSVVATGAAA